MVVRGRRSLALLVLPLMILAGGCSALVGTPAPPSPHVLTGEFKDCRSCHEKGEQGAPVTDHAAKPNCERCHEASGTAGGPGG